MANSRRSTLSAACTSKSILALHIINLVINHVKRAVLLLSGRMQPSYQLNVYIFFTFPYYITLKDNVWLVTLKLLRNLMVQLKHIDKNDGNALCLNKPLDLLSFILKSASGSSRIP